MVTKDNYKLDKELSVTKGFYFDKDEKSKLLFFPNGTALLTYENIYYITYKYARNDVSSGCINKKEVCSLQKKEDVKFLLELEYFLEMAQKENNDFDDVYITKEEFDEIVSYLKTIPWAVSASERILDNDWGDHILHYYITFIFQ